MSPQPFRPVVRQSVSDTVFAQLRDAVLDGGYRPGDSLPAERELAQAFAVNRHAVREAVKRLQEAGFVHVVHGGGTRVLDVRRSAGLDLLGHLARSRVGGLDAMVRDGLEMRRCIGVDAARLAARRADQTARAEVLAAAERYRQPPEGAVDRDFWAAVVDASGNLAFRLALNSLVQAIDAHGERMAVLLQADRDDVLSHAQLAQAIADGESEQAGRLADAVLSQALQAYDVTQRRAGRARGA